MFLSLINNQAYKFVFHIVVIIKLDWYDIFSFFKNIFEFLSLYYMESEVQSLFIIDYYLLEKVEYFKTKIKK